MTDEGGGGAEGRPTEIVGEAFGSHSPDVRDVDRAHRRLVRPGDRVEHYQVTRLLGRGGMGEVYLARDTRLGRRVALKVLRAKALGTERAVARFLHEAQTTARFAHPHIVTVFGAGEHRGHPYVALEYLEGQTLRQRLREGRLGIREATRIGLAVADALREAHRHRVLHRDLKPENVMIPRDGRVRVLDFGLAKRVEAAPPASHDPDEDSATASVSSEVLADPFLSVEAGVRGTPAYMAPEQWNDGEVTGATDIWALGILLFELVTGRHPFGTSDLYKLCYRIQGPEPVPPVGGDVPEALASLVAACTDKDPARRPPVQQTVELLEDQVYGGRRRSRRDRPPFRGLLPCDERDADRFFGRDAEVDAFVERLRHEPTVAVVGPSGAGKSSFVGAGVLPRLREQGPWIVLAMRPGRDPMRVLSSRLIWGTGTLGSSRSSPSHTTEASGPDHRTGGPVGDPNRDEGALAVELKEAPETLALELGRLAELESARVLLFVDQLEELYTLVEDPELRRVFMRALATAAEDQQGPVRVVVTVRDDFLGRLAEGTLARELLSRVAVVRSPDSRQLEQILERSVAAVGHRFEDPDLAREIVSEVEGEQAALPLLQVAGQLLWERRDRQHAVLRRSAYGEIGGVAGALAAHADGVLEGLSAEQIQVARELLLRLVSPEATRRVVPRGELVAGLEPAATPVIERLVDGRLVLVRRARGGRSDGDEAELELAHESLVRTWNRLSRWLDESRDEMAFLAEAGQAADLWERRGMPAGEAWHGEALADALHRARHIEDLPTAVRRFLDAGRRRQERRTRRRRTVIAALLTSLTLVAGVMAALFFDASGQRRVAERKRAEVQREGARAAWTRGDLLEARAKLRTSLETEDSPLARALWWQLHQSPLRWRRTLGGALWDVDFSPDGRRVVTACADGALYLFDTATRAQRLLRGHGDQVTAVAFDPGGERLVSGAFDGRVGLWTLADASLSLLQGHEAMVVAAAFSPSGTQFATASADGSLRIWDATTGAEVRALQGHEGAVNGVAYTPDGQLLVSGSSDGTVRFWDVASGEGRRILRGHEAGVVKVDVSHDGRLVASASSDRTVRIWDVATGGETRVLAGHDEGVVDVAFGPRALVLASAGRDAEVRVWDVETGEIAGRFTGHEDWIYGLEYSPDGGLLATAGGDHSLRLWQTGAAPLQAHQAGHQDQVFGVEFAPGDRHLASGSADGTLRIWDVVSGEQRLAIPGHLSEVYQVSYSPDGSRLASAGGDHTVRLWEAETGREVAVLSGHEGAVFNLAYTPDGRTLASSGVGPVVRLWDPHSGRPQGSVRSSAAAVYALAFHPDGGLLATGGRGGIELWDAATGRAVGRLEGEEPGWIWDVAFARDGTRVAAATDHDGIRVWDVATGESRSLGDPSRRYTSVAFHPSDPRLAAACADGTGWIRSLEGGNEVELRGHRGEINRIRFSEDGARVVTSSADETLRLWDAETGLPYWRAPLVTARPAQVVNHAGWASLAGGEGAVEPPASGWRQEVLREALAASMSGDGSLVCVRRNDDVLSVWSTADDRRRFGRTVAGLDHVAADSQGCYVSTADGQLVYHPADGGDPRTLHESVTAFQLEADRLLVATEDEIHVHPQAGDPAVRWPAGRGVTALAGLGEAVVVGYADGHIEHSAPAGGGWPFDMEDVPASAVTSLQAGPEGTLAAGYANGALGLWSLENGVRLHQVDLHGPVVHLVRVEGALHAVTTLGDHYTMDLTVFDRPYCELLREVWGDVPVVWEHGAATRQAPHRPRACLE